ncbi:MAG: NADH-quinone oxidoreductase subunit NuoN [Magnetococcales bacterium]|nr:NADH-quinone oxidoreductase subunit NuoN [Magnetococcales bacterium]
MNLALMAPEILIGIVAMLLLLLGAWRSAETRRELVGGLALLTLATCLIILWKEGMHWPTSTFNNQYVVDPFSGFMKILMLLATLLPLMISWDYLQQHNLDTPEFFVLTLFALLGGMMMASSGDFISLYLGLELMSLSIYVLAASRRDNALSNEAGLKYFVLGSVASGLLLYGISLLYGVTGSTQFVEIQRFLAGEGLEHSRMVINLGVTLVLAGLSFKVAAAPFHMWAPDVYEGAPTPVTAFMAAMPKVAAFSAFYRVFVEAFAPMHAYWSNVFQLVALLSLAVGAIAAIAQSNLKRMLAYSSIGHVGYILIGLVAGGDMGHQGVLVYLTIYVFMNIGAFGLILMLNKEGIGDNIEDFKGLGHKRPMLALLMAIFMFSMAGIPPLAGFIGKLYIFMAAVKAGYLALAIAGVIFSAIGAFYYIRVVKVIYFDQPREEAFQMPVGAMGGVAVAVCAALVLVWGVFPASLTSTVILTVSTFR